MFIVLGAIAGNPFLRETLYLKGAYATEGHTRLPRSTQDVDFTVIEMLGTPNSDGERSIKRRFTGVMEDHLEVDDRDWRLHEVSVHKSPSAKRHPRGWDSFEVKISLQFRGKTRHTVKLDITPEDHPIETVEISCETGLVVDSGSPGASTVRSYSGNEIVAEKLRAFLQRLPHYRSKTGSGERPPRVRDIRDIAVLVNTLEDRLDIEIVATKFRQKCASRFVDCCSIDDFNPKSDSVEIYRQNYEADPELVKMPFDDAWQVMMDLVRRIEDEYGLPGAFPMNDD